MRASTTGTTRLLSAAGFLMLASLALPYGPGGAAAQTVDTLGGRLPDASGMRCYGRAFDKGHLAAHPKQRITSIALAISPARPSGELRLWPYAVMVRMKGEKAALWQTETCEFNEVGALRCIVACDGGHFTLSAPETGSGLRLELGDHYTLQGGCGDDRKPVVLSARTDEPAYALDAKDMKACRSQFRASRKASEVLREIGGNR
jgi:hypothetical protein